MKSIISVILMVVLVAGGSVGGKKPVAFDEREQFVADLVNEQTVDDITYLVMQKDGTFYIAFPEDSYYKMIDQVQAIEQYAYICTQKYEKCQNELQVMERRASRCDASRFAGLYDGDPTPRPQ